VDVRSSGSGKDESGVWRSVRVVNGIVCRSDGSGPTTVGYVPVQYDIVVETFGDGKMKLTAASPYDITFVIARAPNKEVLLKFGGAGDAAVGDVVVVDANDEVAVLVAVKPELGRDADAVVAVGMLTVTSTELRLPARELELTVGLVKVSELNNVNEMEVKFSVEDEFVPGSRVAKPVEVFGLDGLVNGSLDGSNNDVGLDVRAGVDSEVRAGGTSGVEMGPPVADVRDGNGLDSVGKATEELPTLFVLSGLRLDGLRLLDERAGVVDSGGVRPDDNGSDGRFVDESNEELPT
jgi:hypothetical protein